MTTVLKLPPCIGVAFSPSGASLLRWSREVEAWDLTTRSRRFRVRPLRNVVHCAIHPDEHRIVIKNTVGHIALLDASDGALVRKLDRPKRNEGSNIEFCSTGEFVLDGSWEGELTVRSATTGQVAFQKTFPNELISCVARTRSGSEWFVVHQPKAIADDKPPGPSYISMWGWPLSSPVDCITSSGRIQAIAVSPCNTKLCLVGYESVTVIRLADKKVLAHAPHFFGASGFAVAWSPDGREIATVNRDGFVFYTADTLQRRQDIDMKYAADVAYSPGGDLVVLGSWRSGVVLERRPTEA